MSDCMDRRVNPPKQVTSPTWGPPPSWKQALKVKSRSIISVYFAKMSIVYKN